MATEDTFEWFAGTIAKDAPPEIRRFIEARRNYFFTLRSEDERHRFMEEFREQIRALSVRPEKGES